jgi:hypothetical protein
MFGCVRAVPHAVLCPRGYQQTSQLVVRPLLTTSMRVTQGYTRAPLELSTFLVPVSLPGNGLYKYFIDEIIGLIPVYCTSWFRNGSKYGAIINHHGRHHFPSPSPSHCVASCMSGPAIYSRRTCTGRQAGRQAGGQADRHIDSTVLEQEAVGQIAYAGTNERQMTHASSIIYLFSRHVYVPDATPAQSEDAVCHVRLAKVC